MNFNQVLVLGSSQSTLARVITERNKIKRKLETISHEFYSISDFNVTSDMALQTCEKLVDIAAGAGFEIKIHPNKRRIKLKSVNGRIKQVISIVANGDYVSPFIIESKTKIESISAINKSKSDKESGVVNISSEFVGWDELIYEVVRNLLRAIEVRRVMSIDGD